MKSTSFRNLLRFALFGMALNFFGMLYEGVVVLPGMLHLSREGMLFWNEYYSMISPVVYYIPLVPLATATLIFLYFKASGDHAGVKQKIGIAGVGQLIALLLTFFLIKGIDLRFYFADSEKYAGVIPFKTYLANILGDIRLIFSATALWLTAKAYLILEKQELQRNL